MQICPGAASFLNPKLRIWVKPRNAKTVQDESSKQLMTNILLHLGPSWGHLGTVMGHLWLSWSNFGAILAHLGPTCPSWGYLGPSWSNFGASWGHLCVSWGLLGSVLAYSGAILDHLRTILGDLMPSWGYLGAVLGYLGPSWAILGASWDQERFRNPRPKITVPRLKDLDQF